VSGNMTYILRLYDVLLSQGYEEFSALRESLWRWITRYQIPSAAGDGSLFAQFFEDHDTPTNRTAWAPLNLARTCSREGKDSIPIGATIAARCSNSCAGTSRIQNWA